MLPDYPHILNVVTPLYQCMLLWIVAEISAWRSRQSIFWVFHVNFLLFVIIYIWATHLQFMVWRNFLKNFLYSNSLQTKQENLSSLFSDEKAATSNSLVDPQFKYHGSFNLKQRRGKVQLFSKVAEMQISEYFQEKAPEGGVYLSFCEMFRGIFRNFPVSEKIWAEKDSDFSLLETNSEDFIIQPASQIKSSVRRISQQPSRRLARAFLIFSAGWNNPNPLSHNARSSRIETLIWFQIFSSPKFSPPLSS